MRDQLENICRFPDKGRWGLAVSGGADSVALLILALERFPRDSLHIIHLDHQMRGEESQADANFVRELANEYSMLATIRAYSELDTLVRPQATPNIGQPNKLLSNPSLPPRNLSAKLRSARHRLFRQVVEEQQLAGVIMAHHADDQAETVLLRLLRGSGYQALAGMSALTVVQGVQIARPLLAVRSTSLRDFLRSIGQPWREDASNATAKYARNRVRQILTDNAPLQSALIQLANSCATLRESVSQSTPTLADRFECQDLADLPDLLAEASAGGWLKRQGIETDRISPALVASLIQMCRDAASPARHTGPNGVIIRRRGGRINAEC